MSATLPVARPRRRRLLSVAPAAAQLTAGAAVALFAGIAAWSVLSGEVVAGFVVMPVGFGIAVLLVGLLTGFGVLIGPATVLLLVGYGLSVLGSGSDLRVDAVVVGPAAWLAVECAWWSLEARRPTALARGLAWRRLARFAVTAVGSAAVGLVLIDLAVAGEAGGALLKTVGVAAALGLVGLVAALSRPDR